MKATLLEAEGGIPSKLCKDCGQAFYKRTNYAKIAMKGSKYRGWDETEVCGRCENKLK